MPERCPYSKFPYSQFSDDHIFPQFLGGRRTVRVCKDRNNRFGHTFEGRASKQLMRLQVFISHFGLDLARTRAIWPAALTIGDDTYDFAPGPDGVQYTLNKPAFRRDDEGNILSGKARSLSEANQIAAGLIRSGNAKEVEISADPGEVLEGIKLDGNFTFDQDLYRLATKMAASVLVAFGHIELIASSEIPVYLHEKAGWQTTPAYCDVNPILGMRPALSHAVYAELGEKSYAIVLIFGFVRVFVPLPSTRGSIGLLVYLDPIAGEEVLRETDPVGPRSVPPLMYEPGVRAFFKDMNATLTREAIACGAKKAPQLQTTDFDLGQPVTLPAWVDGTTRFLNLSISRNKPVTD